jgi:hypothetical protein
MKEGSKLMKKFVHVLLFLLINFSTYAQTEFDAYAYSRHTKDSLFNDGRLYFLNGILEIESLISFSKDELRLLRNMIYAKYGYKFNSNELNNYFSKFNWYQSAESNVDNALTEIDKKNIALIQEIELNFPAGTDIDKKLAGVWRFRGGVPDQGYVVGDYIRIYPNGIFEYLFRTFTAIRYGTRIYGGAKYGLWSSKNQTNQITDTEYLNIGKININGDWEEITIYNKIWWHLSKNMDYELDWGDM